MTIEDYAFSCCEGLKQITIPEGLTYIGESAFAASSNVTICGYRNSHAETFAKKKSIPFTYLDESPTEMPDTSHEKASVDKQTVIIYSSIAIATILIFFVLCFTFLRKKH